MDAKIQVNKVRPKWMKWEHKFNDDDVSKICSHIVPIHHCHEYLFIGGQSTDLLLWIDQGTCGSIHILGHPLLVSKISWA